MARRILQTSVSARGVPGGRREELAFRTEGGDPIPAILLLPAAEQQVPAALLLHGYSSRKEHLADSVGMALLRRGVASMAIDLPLHGSRPRGGAPSTRNPMQLFQHWRDAASEARLALRYLEARRETDRMRMAAVGYSLGSFLALATAAADPAVGCIVLAAGGDLPNGLPFAALARTIVDPLAAVRRVAGRPLLMVHGRRDRTVTPDQAERLFAAAAEPKQLWWYDAGHYLPSGALDAAADWLRDQLLSRDAQDQLLSGDTSDRA